MLIFIIERFNFNFIIEFIFVNLFDLNVVLNTETFLWLFTFIAFISIKFVLIDVIESFWSIATFLNLFTILKFENVTFLNLFLSFLIFRFFFSNFCFIFPVNFYVTFFSWNSFFDWLMFKFIAFVFFFY